MKEITKVCRNCKKRFKPQYKTTEVVCQDYNCRVAFALKTAEKQKLAREKKQRQTNALEKSILKEKLKTLKDWKDDLQREINQLIRLIDARHPCIATGTYQGQMQAGHYASLGSNPTIRFHLENIWIQSMHSNCWKSGDTLRYQQGIIDTFGKEYLEYMNSLQSIPPIKLTIEDIKPKIPLVRSLIKWVRLQDRKFSNDERIFLRKQFNNQINIYK
jgi:hypothetical protein